MYIGVELSLNVFLWKFLTVTITPPTLDFCLNLGYYLIVKRLGAPLTQAFDF